MILYEDNEIIVCIKSRGLLSQESSSGQKSMVQELKTVCGSEIYPVHRLDKDVGGVMVYAKTKKAASDLSSQVSDRRMEKWYYAVTAKGDIPPQGRLEDLLYFDKGRNKSFVVSRERRGVKKALLDYRLVETVGDRSLYEVRLITGRTHQVRVQFASRQMPLIGDRKYGGEAGDGIGLFAFRIEFTHPTTGEKMTFQSEADKAIKNSINPPNK